MPVLPMFPLGTVLLPGAVLPLHVFEPRYRRLTADCLDGAGEFGVVLIERGNEVGGGDTRTSVGTVARVVEAVPFPDGRWALTVVGARRIRVRRWIGDDPYPTADTEDWDDPPPTPGLDRALAGAATLLRQVLATAAELGDPVGPVIGPTSEDPVLGSYQATALSPLGPADRQALLAAPTVAARLDLLHRLLEDQAEMLARRIELDGRPPPGAGPGRPARPD